MGMMADNVPDAALNALAQPCPLGGCDAFLSHSWHDDGKAKWKCLQAWSAAFINENRREPSLWIDKFCIDQTNIDMDLRCLPIFLQGCKRLVVLCGPTYLSRLWCVLEIFTFIHMGGRAEDIELVHVLRAEFEDEDETSILDGFANFHARNCDCFKPGDKQRILAIMEAAFEDLGAF